ncbi:MAG: hypothetical protein K9H16_07255 [Bacteroidales bacterium]|nr:hypothetical protein [Bacteroidales bacterium]
MKTLIRIPKAFRIALITITLPIVIGIINISTAQTPPPPNGGDNPGSGNTPVGGGAPITGGIGILLALGAAYGGKKVWDSKRNPHSIKLQN